VVFLGSLVGLLIVVLYFTRRICLILWSSYTWICDLTTGVVDLAQLQEYLWDPNSWLDGVIEFLWFTYDHK
jgi:hypothetical protein